MNAFTASLSILLTFFLVRLPLSSQPGETWLGQTVPGQKAELLAPGLVSLDGRYEFACSFSPDGKTFLFSVSAKNGKSKVMMMTEKNGRWGRPQVMNFTADPNDAEMEAFFSRDGKNVFFAVDGERSCSIYRARYRGRRFGPAVNLGSQVNTGVVFYPTPAADGVLYFTDVRTRTTMMVRPTQGEYRNVQNAGLAFGGHAFVSPDDQSVVFDAGGDIFAAFRLADGKWSYPRRLGREVSSEGYSETCPSFTPDGKVLMFSRYDEADKLSNIYWISASVLTPLRQAVLEGWESDPLALSAWKTVETVNNLWTMERNVEAMAEFFHPDMVFINPQQKERILSRERILEGYRQYVDQLESGRMIAIDPLVQLYNQGRSAVVTYYYDLVQRMQGKSERFRGRDMYFLVREGEKWLCVADQFSPDPGKSE